MSRVLTDGSESPKSISDFMKEWSVDELNKLKEFLGDEGNISLLFYKLDDVGRHTRGFLPRNRPTGEEAWNYLRDGLEERIAAEYGPGRYRVKIRHPKLKEPLVREFIISEEKNADEKVTQNDSVPRKDISYIEQLRDILQELKANLKDTSHNPIDVLMTVKAIKALDEQGNGAVDSKIQELKYQTERLYEASQRKIERIEEQLDATMKRIEALLLEGKSEKPATHGDTIEQFGKVVAILSTALSPIMSAIATAVSKNAQERQKMEQDMRQSLNELSKRIEELRLEQLRSIEERLKEEIERNKSLEERLADTYRDLAEARQGTPESSVSVIGKELIRSLAPAIGRGIEAFAEAAGRNVALGHLSQESKQIPPPTAPDIAPNPQFQLSPPEYAIMKPLLDSHNNSLAQVAIDFASGAISVTKEQEEVLRRLFPNLPESEEEAEKVTSGQTREQ